MNAANEKGGACQCPVCRRFTHTADCPVREFMALTWVGKSADERAAEAHAK